MRTFHITLKGFDPATGKNDHLVKWVAADDEQILQEWLDYHKLRPYVQSLVDAGNRWTGMSFRDGIDVVLLRQSTLGAYQFAVDRWEMVESNFDPWRWMTQSQAASATATK